MNRYELTPAAERALEFSESWEVCEGSSEIHPPELLCGLLAEPECRAALILAGRGIDEAAVQARWPRLRRIERHPRRRGLSAEVQGALQAAEGRLFEYPQPVTLATEHLLLGLTAVAGETASWLAERGLEATALEAEVHRLAGHETNPLPVEVDGFDVRVGQPAPLASQSPTKEPVNSAPNASILKPQAPGEAGVWRALDAAANRAGEGLRVAEDYVRFVLDDARLTAECKLLRHDLAKALARLPASSRRAARDVAGDVGTEITTAAEQERGGASAVAEASCKRAQQALRSLEEFSKTFDAETARQFEALRYRSYTLEQAIDRATGLMRWLATSQFYVLIDGQASPEALTALVKTLVAAEVDIVQLRDKQLCDRDLLQRARVVADAVAGSRTLFIMNDRADLAMLAGASGVHVGQDELTVRDARAIVGSDVLIGVSTHSIEQARQAVQDGADYIGVGPTFPSETKHFDAFTGLELAAAAAREIRLPAFAIGGIDRTNLPQLLSVGMRRIAVSGAVTRAPDPLAAARELRQMLRGPIR